MRFNEQKNIIINLNVHSGQSTRMDCPFCFHANTLQVTKDNGQIKWYCFSASCDAKGITDIEKTMEDINYMVKKKVEMMSKDYSDPEEFVAHYYANPDMLKNVEQIVVEDLVIEWIVGNAVVTTTKSTFEELVK